MFYKEKDDEAKSNMDWAILDKDYSVIRKYIAEFKFLNSFKRVTTVNNLFTILNVNDLTEFKKIIESINKAKVFQIIEKDKIASQK